MQKRTEAEWAELIQEYQESGLPQAEWCKSKVTVKPVLSNSS